ncbi:MAG: hypothetical protein ACPG5B_07660 [Chitinophagales bacterium]
MKHTNNSFKNLGADHELPPEHKKKVLDTIDMTKFLLDIADLFTVKQAAANGNMLNTLLGNSKEKK